MTLPRPPRLASLSPWVSAVWSADIAGARPERTLPTGDMHVAIRVHGRASRLSGVGPRRAGAVVCGARSTPYDKVALPGRTVGVQLRPGAARALFGVAADTIAERHVALDALWGDGARALRTSLAALDDAALQLDLFERALQSRLRAPRAPHPDVLAAVALLDAGRDVASVVAAADRSHRRFIALFRAAVGIAPKRYACLRRFRRVLASASGDACDWAAIADAHGYCDQSHLIREFRAFSGLTPEAWRAGAAGTGQFRPRPFAVVRASSQASQEEPRHGRA
ncbi:helix-turn-helix transcriptional regulator [Tolypothrix campylonemoides VB511288]|nr:helix-turn-helix transcriptional regulator [Tolypothrix campylonemoides VB511288]